MPEPTDPATRPAPSHPVLVNLETRGTQPGDFALDHLQPGDVVEILYREAPGIELAEWVRLTAVPPPRADPFLPLTAAELDRQVYTGTLESGGDPVRFARCNINRIA